MRGLDRGLLFVKVLLGAPLWLISCADHTTCIDSIDHCRSCHPDVKTTNRAFLEYSNNIVVI